MKASDAIAVYLSAHGITDCYELIGGMITHIVDSLGKHGDFNITSVHHEQSAAFAAEGVSRKSAGKKVGFALATSGPGATNLITGIGSCWFDSVPCLFITGQVNIQELKGDREIRQQGFQELDIVSLVRPITKYSIRVLVVEDLLPEIHKALEIALNDRQGPVLIDIPNNIQREDIPFELVEYWTNRPLATHYHPKASIEKIELLKGLICESRRPLFLFGGGAKWSSKLTEFINDLNVADIPYVSSLMGQESLEWTGSYLGMVGSYGHRSANAAVQNCDLLVVVGSRMDVRQTGSKLQDFAKYAKIVQIDIDCGQIDNRVKSILSLNDSSDNFFEIFHSEKIFFPTQDPLWAKSLRNHFKKTFVDEYSDWEISPFRLFNQISLTFKGKKVDFICDVGNHQMWAAHCLKLDECQSIFHSGGMGAMGFALPTAIGVSACSSGKTVVLTGDGSLQVNIQELDTISRIGMDVLIIVFNNKSLGMVKNFQDLYFEGRNSSTKNGYSSPSFAKVSNSFGIESYVICNETEFEFILNKIKDAGKPILLEICMEEATECRPRLLFGNPINKQYPLRDDFEFNLETP